MLPERPQVNRAYVPYGHIVEGGAFLVCCKGNFRVYPVRIAGKHIIDGVAVLIDTGIDAHLIRVLPLTGQLHYRAGSVGTPLFCFPAYNGLAGSRRQGKASVRAEVSHAAYAAGALRALCQWRVITLLYAKGYKNAPVQNRCRNGIICL